MPCQPGAATGTSNSQGSSTVRWELLQATHRLQTSSCVASASRCRNRKDDLSCASRQQHEGQAIQLITGKTTHKPTTSPMLPENHRPLPQVTPLSVVV